jgi:hypothetical protein
MQKFIFSLFIIISAQTAFAGVSSQDPMIASLRTRFAAAGSPAGANLRLNEDWACRQFQAEPGDYTSQTKSPVTFVKFDGIVQEKENLNQPEASETLIPKDFVFQARGLVSVMPYTDAPNDAVGYLTIRVSPDGFLIIEWSILGTSQKGRTAVGSMNLDPSIAFPGASAIAYDVCQPN